MRRAIASAASRWAVSNPRTWSSTMTSARPCTAAAINAAGKFSSVDAVLREDRTQHVDLHLPDVAGELGDLGLQCGAVVGGRRQLHQQRGASRIGGEAPPFAQRCCRSEGGLHALDVSLGAPAEHRHEQVVERSEVVVQLQTSVPLHPPRGDCRIPVAQHDRAQPRRGGVSASRRWRRAGRRGSAMREL